MNTLYYLHVNLPLTSADVNPSRWSTNLLSGHTLV